MAKRSSLIVRSNPRADGWLSIVEVSDHECVLSNGDTLLIRWEKLRMLCEGLCQEQASVFIRVWATRDGNEMRDELIEVRRWSGPEPTKHPETLPIDPGVF